MIFLSSQFAFMFVSILRPDPHVLLNNNKERILCKYCKKGTLLGHFWCNCFEKCRVVILVSPLTLIAIVAVLHVVFILFIYFIHFFWIFICFIPQFGVAKLLGPAMWGSAKRAGNSCSPPQILPPTMQAPHPTSRRCWCSDKVPTVCGFGGHFSL